MKFGLRTPSIKKRIAARTSWKRIARHSMGLKAPRGMGIFTNPKRALYNKVYSKTSVGVDKLFRNSGHVSSPTNIKGSSVVNALIFIFLAIFFFPFALLFLGYKFYKRNKQSGN